jgi:predicted nuclease of predicted toxin-antitoxin system
MRFVIDMNLSPTWVDVLVKMGHHAVHWSTVGHIDATDTQIMEWAREHGSIVFTHDLDYGALLHATAAEAPSVIQIRSEDVRPEKLAGCVTSALQACQNDLATGALVTIDPRRWRISLLPLTKHY